MCSAPKVPAPTPVPTPPTKADSTVQAAGGAALTAARMASAGQTILTGPLGAPAAGAVGKTLLGQ